MQIFNCARCNNRIIAFDSYRKRKYCSVQCGGFINHASRAGEIGGKMFHKLHPDIASQNGKKGWLTNLKNKTAICGMSHEQHVQAGKKGGPIGGKMMVEYNRKHKLGPFFNEELHKRVCSLGGIKSNKLRRVNKTGFYGMSFEKRSNIGKKNWKKSNEINKRNKTGFYGMSHKQRSEIGKRSGPKTIKILRERRQWLKFGGISYDSKQEVLLSQKLEKKYSSFHPIQNVTVHRTVGHKEFDFLVRNTFIDYHALDISKSLQQYYDERRKILNENGFSNANYIVLTKLGNFNLLSLNKEGLL